jgi:hypothetical protein
MIMLSYLLINKNNYALFSKIDKISNVKYLTKLFTYSHIKEMGN